MKWIRKIWDSFETLDDRIFFLAVTVSMLLSIVVYIADIIAGLTPEAQIAVLVIFFIMVVLLCLGIRFPKKRSLLRLCFIAVLNFVMFPLSFFYSGGIQSGMILFYLAGLFLVPVMTHGKTGILLFFLSLFAMIITIDIAQHRPDLVAPMTLDQHYQDVKVTLIISGVGLCLITVLILWSYNQERVKNEKLMESLRTLSIKDSLSGLYNRRELVRRLEVMYGSSRERERKTTLVCENHYIAMFDIDNFKKINDTYGHAVGDRVLQEISRVLNELADPEQGEIAARYGGEEFVCILSAQSEEEAFQRVDQARKKIASLKWENDQPPVVTISGGIISCNKETGLTASLKAVDDLLYQAKASGKNRICRPASA